MWHLTVAFQYQASECGMPSDSKAYQHGHTSAVTTILVSGNPSSGWMHTPSDTSICVYLCPMAPSPVCAQHRSWIGVCILCGILLPLCLNMNGLPICFGGKARLLILSIGGRDGAPVTSLAGLLHFSSLSASGFSWSMSDFRVFPCSA